MGKFAALIVLGLSATAALAGEITSVYSDLDLKTCKALELYNGQDNGEGGVWECKGIEGFDVLYLEGDLARLCGLRPGGAQPVQLGADLRRLQFARPQN